MDISTLKPEMRTSTTSGKMRIVQRFLEREQSDRLRIMRGIVEPLAERTRRVFVVPRRTIIRMPSPSESLRLAVERMLADPRRQAEFNAIEAYFKRGDDGPIRELADERIGERNALAVVGLRLLINELGDELPYAVLPLFFAEPYETLVKAGLTPKEYEGLIPELEEEAHRAFHLFGEHRLGLAYLHPDKPEQAAKRLEILALGHEELWRPNRIANRVRDKRPKAEEALHGSPQDLPLRPRGNHDEGLFRIRGDEIEDEDYAPNERDRLLSIVREVVYGGDHLSHGFTERDIQVLRDFGDNRPDEEVAAELSTSPANVRKIRERAYEKVRKLA